MINSVVLIYRGKEKNIYTFNEGLPYFYYYYKKIILVKFGHDYSPHSVLLKVEQ